MHGDFIIHAFENEHGQEHVLLSVGLPSADPDAIALIRIHSECLTGDAFGSLKCDCGPQLNTAMQMIQEGRGIGLVNKIRAYALQDQGHDTLDANLMLNLPADARTYEMCEIMLKHVGIDKAKLLTNNPNKLAYLQALGIDVVERVPLLVGVNPFNAEYLAIKGAKMGHFIPTHVKPI